MDALVFNYYEWERSGWFTKEELDSASDNGFIDTKFGVACYLARPVLVTT